MFPSKIALCGVIVLTTVCPQPTAATPTRTTTNEQPIRSDSEVVGGAQAPLGKWDDAAAIYIGDSVSCTGVLIAPDVVLTAGHCIGGIHRVKVAANDIFGDGEAIDVRSEHRFPRQQGRLDIGVLVLEREATTPWRLLARGCVLRNYLKDQAPVSIVGYGAIDIYGNSYSTELREAKTFVTDPDCTRGRGCRRGELGAGGNGIDACFGDSGGPLYLHTEVGDYVVGLTSRSFSDVSVPCAEGGIYTRPDAAIEWIENVIGKSLPEATCNVAPTTEPISLHTTAGATVSANLHVSDPNADDVHTFSLGRAPAHGTVEITPDGMITFRADDDYDGPDSFEVIVSDTGIPPLQATAPVTVTVESTGCQSGTGGGWLIGIFLVIVTYRPRQSHP